MYKVLIADDEKRICKLIRGLVDWDEKGLVVVGIVHNGQEALNIVKQDKPDIIITDIRMPELGGLELIREVKKANPEIDFIIISGYRQFEYARKALQYGAEDYLLKPIREKELNRVLDQIVLKKKDTKVKEEQHRHLEQSAMEHTKILNQTFVQELISGTLSNDILSDQRLLNREYQYSFPYKSFVVAGIRMDVDSENTSLREIQEILKKRVYAIVDNNLGDLEALKYTAAVVEEVLYLVINFMPTEWETLRHAVRHVISDTQNIGSKSMPVHATVGMSTIADQTEKLPECVRQVHHALADRVVKGVDRIIDAQTGREDKNVEDYISYSVQRQLLGCVESRNLQGVLDIIRNVRQELDDCEESSGRLLRDIWKEIVELLLVGCKAFLGNKDAEDIRSNCVRVCEMYYKKEQLEHFVRNTAIDIFNRMSRDEEEKEKKPIQIARQYISLHYAESLTLETVSAYVDLNAAYFSSIFKKETGQSFSEFLTEVRMKKARELLCDRKRTVLEIADSVGYGDEKYFSRSFKKHVGLTPSEYRRLYC